MLAAIVLAAGLGTRMKSAAPKVLHKVAGRPMVAHVLATVRDVADLLGQPVTPVVVIGPDMPELEREVAPARTALQSQRRGTGHAVQQAMPAVPPGTRTVLILYGDCPLIEAPTLQKLIAAQQGAALSLLTFSPPDTTGYGRIILESDGGVARIVEHKDATDAERAVPLCNAGIYAADADLLPDLLAKLTDNNVQKEFYLTDIVAHARALGHRVVPLETDWREVQGINSRAELALVEQAIQLKLRRRAMAEGATLIDPATTYLSFDTKLGQDVVVEPNVFFGPGVRVGDRVTIKAFSHIEGATISDGAVVGPFARLRPGAAVGPEAHVGNFVELKNTTLGAGAKANHLTYLGDATVGAGSNIGAGVITCNYDGFIKSRTEIGKNSFIGSNSALVAPLTVGDGAIVGAGSTLTRDVPPDSIVTTRGDLRQELNAAPRFRTKRADRKNAGRTSLTPSALPPLGGKV
jgi:bifunctional UDP-N-acetylglucosamine pyrophosphorylase/glucosamine-1-phosphate N-acetyltransferase